MADTQNLNAQSGGHRVYPSTVATSVSFNGNKTVDTMLKGAIYTASGTPTADKQNIDATTLNGHNSTYYATKDDIALLTTMIDALSKRLDELSK